MNFAGIIISWYRSHKRNLPWRKTSDPYIIWLSEIIMQQTRVEQGTPYFNRFAEAFPTVGDFAAAEEDEILKLWQGLGYYSRGRNMHHTARRVMEDHAGYFPSDYNSLIRLKGIGEYTAAAIASFAANEPKAVVDGNVFRLLSRYFGIDTPINSGKGKKLFTELANELMDKDRAGEFNQAMMEFGSLQCRPKNPDCSICPLQLNCEARKTKKITELPVKVKTIKVRDRYFNYIIAIKDDQILINKRMSGDIWENLHDLPMFETTGLTDPEELLKSESFISCFGKGSKIHSVSALKKHILSHQRLHTRFIQIDHFSEDFTTKKSWFYINLNNIEKFAQPKLIFQFFENFLRLTK